MRPESYLNRQRLNMRFFPADHPRKKTEMPAWERTGDEEKDKKTRKFRKAMFTNKMKYKWVGMDGDLIFPPQMKTSYAYYIVEQLLPQDGCLLDFFSAGTFSRVALIQEKKSVALENDDRKRFLESFFTHLEKLASGATESESMDVGEDREGGKEEVEQEESNFYRGEPSGTSPDVHITRTTVIPDNLDDVINDLQGENYAEALDRLKRGDTNEDTLDGARKGIANLERNVASNDDLGVMMPLIGCPFVAGDSDKVEDEQMDDAFDAENYGLGNSQYFNNICDKMHHEPPMHILRPFGDQDTEDFNEVLRKSLVDYADENDQEILEKTGYTEMETEDRLELVQQQIHVANAEVTFDAYGNPAFVRASP